MGQLGNQKGIVKWGDLRLSIVTCLDFFPSQAKKKLAIFLLWHERMGGHFFRKFPLVLVLTLISGFGFRKFQMDDVGRLSWGLGSGFSSKVVFWLLALLPTLRTNPGASDEDVWPERGTGHLHSGWVPSLTWPLTGMCTHTGTLQWAVRADEWAWISGPASVRELCAGLICSLCFIPTWVWLSVSSQPPSVVGNLTSVTVETLPSLGG